ncbi:hypothetical protein IFM89_012006 [Coptis chinensis]|uniref:Transposase MuDR plant domain-containing protein n=1 Tax=Coptis chinensis TaxID=261450 RepID=A0A835IWB0_9MAGN|nr:hypothetical protein IFM89_012006 [Coptis chinensis]
MDCLAMKNLMVHYHGSFQETPDGSLYDVDNYRGGVLESVRNVDRDKLNIMDLVADLKENYFFDISLGFSLLYLLNDEKCLGTLDESDEDMNDDLPPIIPVMSDPQPQNNSFPPHTTNKSSLNISAPPPHISSFPPLQISSPPPPPPPRVEDDEGYRSKHSSEAEEEFEIANRLDFNDFIAMTDNVFNGDDGSEQFVNKPQIWKVGMEWPNIRVLRDDIKDFCIANRFAGDLVNNERKRFRVVCLGEDKKKVQCSWFAHFKLQNNGFTMRLNTLKEEHTCEADCDMLNKMANANWVVRKIEEQMKNATPRVKTKPWTRSRTVTGESTLMDRTKKIVRKTKSGMKKEKKIALKLASVVETTALTPSNAPPRVAPPRHDHTKQDTNSRLAFFMAPEQRHSMGDLIKNQAKGVKK